MLPVASVCQFEKMGAWTIGLGLRVQGHSPRYISRSEVLMESEFSHLHPRPPIQLVDPSENCGL